MVDYDFALKFDITTPYFVEIKPANTQAIASLWLRLPKGHALELPGNTSPRWLAELLQCLG